MSDDLEVNWEDDDMFDIDFDFDDDFDNIDPFKGQTFVGAAASGFLSGLFDGTVGSTDAILKSTRTLLPKSFSNALDKVDYIRSKGVDLIREFKEENYESAKSLQNIAKGISEKLNDGVVKRSLENISSKDLSDWEKYSSSRDNETLSIGETSEDELRAYLNETIERQEQTLTSGISGINEMAANVGARISGMVSAGNSQLIGIQSHLKDIVDYQRNVQAKLDQAKLEIMTRTFLVNSKYYKFMEAGQHAVIKELRGIKEYTSKSDYEKTSTLTATKEYLRTNILNTIGAKSGGLINRLASNFNKSGRKDKYNTFEDIISSLDELVNSGIQVTPNMVAHALGGNAANLLINQAPYLLNQGPFAKLLNKINPEAEGIYGKIGRGYNRLSNYGNTASYLSNGGLGLLNSFGDNWEWLDEDPYMDYEDYVAKMEADGKEPLGKFNFTLWNFFNRQGRSALNNIMTGDRSRGTRYTIKHRTVEEISKPGVWKEINNIALTDVIPGLLSRILTSLERSRTGNDSYTAPTYNYVRGQFISSNNNKKIVESDLYSHSEFSNAASSANSIVDRLENGTTKKLTPKQRADFATVLLKELDKGNNFNPYYFVNQIEGLDPETSAVVNDIIKEKFNISNADLEQYNRSDNKAKMIQSAFSFKGDAAGELNEIAAMSAQLAGNIPNIAKNFSLLRTSGNEQVLRDLGILITEDGVDKIDNNKVWERLMRYLTNPNDPELKGSINHADETPLPSLLNTMNDNQIKNTQDLISSINESSIVNFGNIEKTLKDYTELYVVKSDELIKTVNDVGEVLFESLEKLNDSKLTSKDFKESLSLPYQQFSLPDNYDSIPNHLSEMEKLIGELVFDADRKQKVLEEIAGCACRSAGGWGKLTPEQKDKINSEETQAKEGFFNKLRKMSKGEFDKSMEILMKNQPLILGGAIAGLGAVAMNNPKAAMLIAGTAIAVNAYNYIGSYANAKQADDSQDILDEDHNVVLSADKLAKGEYADSDGNIIKSWKDIKTAVRDLAKNVWIGADRLSGKLFNQQNKEVVLNGLSKTRKIINKIWNKADIFGKFKDGLKAAGRAYYQQDVYIKGERSPVLTRNKFADNRYYGYDLSTGETYPIDGFDKIKGPVYEIDQNGELSQVVSDIEYQNGLVTSTGVNISKLARFGINAGKSVKDLFKNLGGKVNPALQGLKEKASNAFSSSGIENRLDNIYQLLLGHFGYTSDPFAPSGITPVKTTPESVNDIVNEAIQTPSTDEPSTQEGPTYKNIINSPYPDKIRLNSFAYKDKKSKEDLQEEANKAIIETRDLTREIKDKEENVEPEKKKGFFGNLKDAFLSKGGLLGTLTKIVTNPIGWMAESLVNSTVLMGKLGWGLFRTVLGVGSPIYNMLSWGFGGMMWGLRKLLFSNTESFGEMIRLRKGGRVKRKTRRSKIKRGFGKAGKLLALAGVTYGAYKLQDGVRESYNEGKGALSNMLGGTDAYESFYNGSEGPQDDAQDDYQDNEGFGMDDALMTATSGLTAYQYGKTAKAGYDKLTGRMPVSKEPGNISQLFSKIGGKGTALLEGSKMGEMALAVSKLGMKGASKFIPILGQVLMAMDAYEGFTDKEQLSDIYHQKTINATQAAANGITNILDLGGLVSGGMNYLADATGLDFLKQEGGMTRALSKVLQAIGNVPVIGAPIALLNNIDIDLSSPQAKIRMAQYGVLKLDSLLGKLVDTLEFSLEKYVKYNKDKAWIDQSAPVARLLSSFPDADPEQLAVWFEYRFKPVYLVYQAAIRSTGYPGLKEYDRDKTFTVLIVARQVQGAITQIQPYPLDVMTQISEKIGIASQENVQGRIKEWMEELEKEQKDKGVDENGMMEVTNKINTDKEDKEKHKEDALSFNVLQSVANGLKVANDYYNDKAYKIPVEIQNIDISDLHKDGNTEIDELTMVRLNAYGNTENVGWRIDAVLKLERYCESLFVISNYKNEFKGNPEQIRILFLPVFRAAAFYKDDWLEWFNKRFLPVFKCWCTSVFRLRSAMPHKSWLTLSATNKYTVAKELNEVMVTVEKRTLSIWEIGMSPFREQGYDGQKSGKDSSRNNALLNNLGNKAKQARIKDNAKEARDSMATSDRKEATISEEFLKKQKERAERMNKGDFLSNNQAPFNIASPVNNSGETTTSTGNSNSPSIPNGSPAGPTDNISQKDIDNGLSDIKVKGKGKGISVPSKEAEQDIIKKLAERGVTDPKAIAFALANANVESGAFKSTTESLIYNNAARAKELFSALRGWSTDQIKSLVSKGSAAVASVVYGTGQKAKDLGNRSPQDGADYLGRGFIQLTGRSNVAQYQKNTKYDVLNHPELISDNKDVAADSASWFLTKKNGALDTFIRTGSFDEGVKKINSAKVDLARRKSLYNAYLSKIENGSLNIKVDPNQTDDQSAQNADTSSNENNTAATTNSVDVNTNTSVNNTVNDIAKNDPVNNVNNMTVQSTDAVNGNEENKQETIAKPIAPERPEKTEIEQPKETTIEKPIVNEPATNKVVQEPAVQKQEPPKRPVEKEPAPLPPASKGPIEVVDTALASAVNNLAQSLARALNTNSGGLKPKGVPTN